MGCLITVGLHRLSEEDDCLFGPWYMETTWILIDVLMDTKYTATIYMEICCNILKIYVSTFKRRRFYCEKIVCLFKFLIIGLCHVVKKH